MSVFENFTHLYNLSKTLKFELKPYLPEGMSESEKEKYLESFWTNYLECALYRHDNERKESYPIVKELLDIFHRRFIKDALSTFVCAEGHTWQDLFDLYIKDKKAKTFADMQKSIREDIVKHFKAHEWWPYIDSPKGLIEEVIPNLITNDDDFFDEAKERLCLEKDALLSHLARYSRFSMFFEKYKKNRENMYKSEDQGTAVANRIVNDNFPKFADNIIIYQRLKDNCLDQLKEVESNLDNYLNGKKFDDVFTPSYFNECLTQTGIVKINWLIGGNPNEDVIGINDVGNKFVQHNPQTTLRLKDLRMSMLFKQILSDREQLSYLPPQFSSGKDGEEELIAAIEQFSAKVQEQDLLGRVSRVFAQLASAEVDASRVYVAGSNITSLSKMLYGSWNALGEALRSKFVAGGSKKAKLEKEKDLTEWVSNKTYSLADILSVEKDPKYNLLGEHTTSIHDFLTTLTLDQWDSTAKKWSKNALLEECNNGYATRFLPVQELYKNGTSISTNESCKDIKAYLDKYLDILHACEIFRLGKKEALFDKDAVYTEYNSLFDTIDDDILTLSDIIPLYNKVRSFLTRKVSDEGKMLLKFDSPTRANGWNDCSIVRKEGDFYLVLYISGLNQEEKSQLLEASTCEYMQYYQQKTDFKNFPRWFINSKKDRDAPAVAKYNLPIETIKEDYKRCRELTSSQKKLFMDENPSYQLRLIDYYKLGVTRHQDFAPYKENLENSWRPSSEYSSLQEFFDHTQKMCYKIEWSHASFEYLVHLQQQGKIYLFRIYNKDFAKRASGTPNMHTMYWKEAFSEANMKDIIYKLSSQGIELFYRRKLLASSYTHKKSSVLVNKTYADGTPVSPEDYKAFVKHFNREEIELTDNQVRLLPQVKTNRAKIDIVKDKRYTEHKFMFHVPITINFKSDDLKSEKQFNEYTLAQLREHKDEINIIGIDRGERNLVYVSVINQRGENIIPPRHFNLIETPTFDGNNRTYNYLEKLKQVEGNRDEARKNWTKIENIKELKSGYLSQVVHEISKLVVQYNAIIVLEDLNFGFKRGRFNVERQVYQNFEKMLIQKLNFLVFKKGSPSASFGNIQNGLQLTAPFTSFKDLGKQSGWLFYVPAEYTSKIDAETGFVNLFNMKEAAKNPVAFFNAFHSIEYHDGLFYFTFDYSNNDLPTVKTDYTNVWTLSSHGDRIAMMKNVESQKMEPKNVNLTEEMKTVFCGKIELDSISKDAIIHHPDAESICRELFYKFKLLLQMRNSMPNDETVDYLISPVATTTPFKTGPDNALGIKDADANGAYHIALKGLYLLLNDFPKEGDYLQRITTTEWLKFVQMHTYRS